MAPVEVTGACALLLGLSRVGEKGAAGAGKEGEAGSEEKSEDDEDAPPATGVDGVVDDEKPKRTASRDCW